MTGRTRRPVRAVGLDIINTCIAGGEHCNECVVYVRCGVRFRDILDVTQALIKQEELYFNRHSWKIIVKAKVGQMLGLV